MKKSDLQDGWVVEFRDGNKFRFFEKSGLLICIKDQLFISIERYTEDLKRGSDKHSHDIVKVYKPNYFTAMVELKLDNHTLIWERKEIVLTELEKQLLFSFPQDSKWIARDKNNSGWLFDNMPWKGATHWNSDIVLCLGNYLDNNAFKFITWEDEKPTSLDELRKLAKNGK